jgi:transcriptional regulator with XRE-family HTH domain
VTDMANAGTFLREVRIRHGVTQRELAERAHTQQSSISRMELGHVSPTVATLDRLLRSMDDTLGLVAAKARVRDGAIVD